MQRTKISTKDVDLPDSVSIQLEPGITGDDLAVVTDESMQSKAIKEYARDLAFMEDKVTFSIAHSEVAHAVNPVECGVQGIKRSFFRGQRYTVERKFINALINICFNVETVNSKDPRTGLDTTKVERIPYMAYPISIHSDPSPIGSKWLEFKMNGDSYVKH